MRTHERNRKRFFGELRCGRIKDVRTGDTLCDPDHAGHSWRNDISRAVISITGWTKTKADQGGGGGGGGGGREIPVEPMKKQDKSIISGMGELHLDIIVDRLRREFKVEANVGAPQVAYRETIQKKSALKRNMPSKQEDADNTDTFLLLLPHKKPEKDTSLKMKWWEGAFQRIYSSRW